MNDEARFDDFANNLGESGLLVVVVAVVVAGVVTRSGCALPLPLPLIVVD